MAEIGVYDNGVPISNTTGLYGNLSGYNGTNYQLLHHEIPILKYIMLTCFIFTFLFGITGNGLVIYIIAYFSKVREKSVANYYIWNLAFADELFIVALPLFCYNTFTHQWPYADSWFGDASCKVAMLLLHINKFASVLTLVALSADRYLASYHRLAYMRTIQVGKFICVCIWLLCFAVCIPQLMFSRVKKTQAGAISCSPDWPEPSVFYYRLWTCFSFAFGLVIPFILIVLSYAMLLRRFRALVRLQKKSGKRMTQTVIAVVVTFLVCQTPYYVMYFIHVHKTESYAANNTKPSQRDIHLYGYLNGIATILVFISSCCNPIIYALFNENFRKLYRLVLCQCRTGVNPSEEFKDVELDGKYVPVNLKVKVTFHVPCPFPSKSRKRAKRQQTRTSVDVETGLTEAPPPAPISSNDHSDINATTAL